MKDNENYCKLYYEAMDKSTEMLQDFYGASTRPLSAENGSIESQILKVKDPKQYKVILKMDTFNKNRFMASTDKELEGFLSDPTAAKLIPTSQVPTDEQLLETLCAWVTKFINGKYDKTKARIVIRGNLQEKNDKILLLLQYVLQQCWYSSVLLLCMDGTSINVTTLVLFSMQYYRNPFMHDFPLE